jgi:hypothetical protein
MSNRALRFLPALILAAATAAAQEPAPSPTPAPAGNGGPGQPAAETSGIILAPKPREYAPEARVDSDGTTRTVSAGVAAALAEGMPRYSPPTPSPTPTPEVEDMKDIDKPKNGIIRLPKYLVRESRPPIFRPRDLYTQTGLIDQYFKSHPGLVIGNLLGLNEAAALDMLRDDQRQENISDMADTAHAMAAGGDTSEGSYILQQTNATYMRGGGTWDWSGTGPVGGILEGGSK